MVSATSAEFSFWGPKQPKFEVQEYQKGLEDQLVIAAYEQQNLLTNRFRSSLAATLDILANDMMTYGKMAPTDYEQLKM